jgi:hypothetical protein
VALTLAVKLLALLLLLASACLPMAQARTVTLSAGQTVTVACSSDALRVDRAAPPGLAVTVQCYADAAPPGLAPAWQRTAR